jgi:hypothetical protein
MDESFASLAVMELPGGPVGADAGQRRHVEHPPKSAIAAVRPVQITMMRPESSGTGSNPA